MLNLGICDIGFEKFKIKATGSKDIGNGKVKLTVSQTALYQPETIEQLPIKGNELG